MTTFFVVFFVSLTIMVGAVRVCNGGELKMMYYEKTCPSVETMVRDITWSKVAASPPLAAKLLRLHFHDCFVRGCDASILLDSNQTNTAEKSAVPNRSVAGYEVIDEIKTKLEQECPGIVSCADIVALVARDAVSHQFQSPMWQVLTGRKDGRVSFASEAESDLPSSAANFTTLLSQFTSRGLDINDLVTLSGAHTIGTGHCFMIANRIYNFTGNGDTDPSLNPDYAKTLRTLCPNSSNLTITAEMDPQSSLSFDSHYFEALNQNKGFFQSDAALLTDTCSVQIVRTLQDPRIFFASFGESMNTMGTIGVLTGGDGEIRKNCRVVNV